MVKEPDQMKIADIESKHVGFNMPYCLKHGILMKVKNTIRSVVDEEQRKLTVTRRCYCPECRKEGVKKFLPVHNTRYFKKNAPHAFYPDKQPNDEN